MSFTILTGKEGQQPKKPLFLVSITAPDGDVCYLTTAAYYGTPSIVFNGNTYLARIQKNDILPIQAMSPQGYDSIPGFKMSISDADKFIWTNHVFPHGWRGSQVTLTVILWDVVANQYSTDMLQWTFIGGNAGHVESSGQTTLEVTSATNFARLKMPSVPIEFRCPWVFPTTSAQRDAALNDPTSIYYQCGYSPDQPGGVGNLNAGVPFTECDFTRSSPTDPTVGCMARMGNPSATSVAPDGDLAHDIAGHATGTFGGITWLAPLQYSGRQYTSGQKVYGFNQQNTAIAGAFYNMVYGTQWVQGDVLAPAGDPNSLRSEVAVCLAPFGPCTVHQVLVNGVNIPQNGSDPLFTWRYINQGGRNGSLNADAIFNRHGDPHGSVCVIEFVVPAQLAAPGSIPTVQVLVTSGPLLNVYAIASIAGSTVTFSGPNYSCVAGTRVILSGTNGADGIYTVSSAGSSSIDVGTPITGSGGGVFFFAPPDLYDTGGSLVANPNGNYQNIAGPAANLVFAYLDMMMWGNVDLSKIDPASWYSAAQDAATTISFKDAAGQSQQHGQFKASFRLTGDSRQALSQIMTGLRNAGNLMVAPNGTTGKIQCFIRKTLNDQQGSAVPGSNYNTPVASFPASNTSGVPSLSTPGFLAYLFDESNVEKDSFKIVPVSLDSTPNTVSAQFQDEYNGYQQDSITEIDSRSYAYSGNLEVQVPVPMLGAPNFDQLTRCANVQLAEALYGNPRNDPGGTWYFEFTTNHRVLHLASRQGYICGLNWQSLGIGGASPQEIRVLSIQPDTDGEHWHVRAAWHNDEWYTYSYGQNPTPYQNNPLLSPVSRPPYPYKPGPNAFQWPNDDALFAKRDSFAYSMDLSAYPAQLSISGAVASNVQPSGRPPLVPLQASTSNTGGTIKPGTYLIAISTNGALGPVSNFVVAVVPAGTNTNTITVSGIQWVSGAAPSIQPYVGESSMSMREAAGGTYAGSSPDSNGNPTVFTFTSIGVDGLGLPDVRLAKFKVEEQVIEHGGVWGDEVNSATVGVSQTTLSFPAASWTANQWAGYVLSLYHRPVAGGGGLSATQQPSVNLPVVSSTSNTLVLNNSPDMFQAGDIVVMRAKAGHITSNTIGDDNFINSYSPSGLTTNDEIGNLIYIIGGTGAGQSPKVVTANSHTVYTIAGSWDVTPDATSVFIVLAPTVFYSYYTQPVQGSGSSLSLVAKTQAINTNPQSLLVTVSTSDSDGNTGPWQYQAQREMYVPTQEVALPPTAPDPVGIASLSYQFAWSDPSQQYTSEPDSVNLILVYTVPGGWTGTGVHCYVEDPDQSSISAANLSGSQNIDGSSNIGGTTWTPADEGQFPDDGTHTAIIKGLPVIAASRDIRVYPQAYNNSSDPKPVRANQVGATVSGTVTVPGVSGTSTGPAGREYADVVTGLTAIAQYTPNGQGQWTLTLFVSWTPPTDLNWGGAQVFVLRPLDNAQTVAAGRRGATVSNVHQSLNSGIIFGSTWQVELSNFPSQTQFATIRVLSSNFANQTNSYVQGITPEIKVEIDPPPQGNSGQEFCGPVAAFFGAVIYSGAAGGNTSVDGTEKYGFGGTVTPPADPQYGGFKVVLHNEADGTNHTNDVTLGVWGPTDTSWNTDMWPIPSSSPTWDLYCVSYDVNNQDNSLQPGFTPRVTGLTATAQTSGSMVATRLSSSTYATTFAVLSSKFDVATAGVGTSKIAAASITQALMANASIGTAQIISASITGALIASATITGANIASATITDANIVSLSATKITAGTISAVTITSLTCNGGAISGTSLTLATTGPTITIGTGTIAPSLYGISILTSGNGLSMGADASGNSQIVMKTSSGTGVIDFGSGSVGLSMLFGTTGVELLSNKMTITSLPSANPGAGTKQVWYDPADGNRLKYSP